MPAGSVRRATDEQTARTVSLVLPGSTAASGAPLSRASQPPNAQGSVPASAHILSVSTWRWFSHWWRRSTDVESSAAAHGAPSSPQQGSWAGGNHDAATLAGNRSNSAAVQRGARWLPFLPLRPSAPAADRAAEAAALRGVSAGGSADAAGASVSPHLQTPGCEPVHLCDASIACQG